MESLPVPSVQAMVAATGGDHVPPRYLRPEAAADTVTGAEDGDCEAQIPIIDHRRLLLELDRRGEESARLHSACQDWGFFQGMKASIQEFFRLPAETKRRFAQQRGRLEGYGQLFVVSEDQKLDWADMLFYYTQPPESRNAELWPDQPASFRWTLDRYASAVKDIADSLVATMVRNLGLKQEVITDRCIGGLQTVRMNYYPPCSQADKVTGLYPHSDADLLTLVLQVNHVHGLQIKWNGSWLPVTPAEGAFVVNIGDTFEILTNGRYRSIEHRVVVDPKEERLSVAAFHSPNARAMIGPLKELMARADGEEEAYETVEHERFRELFFATKLEGKSFMERMKLK